MNSLKAILGWTSPGWVFLLTGLGLHVPALGTPDLVWVATCALALRADAGTAVLFALVTGALTDIFGALPWGFVTFEIVLVTYFVTRLKAHVGLDNGVVQILIGLAGGFLVNAVQLFALKISEPSLVLQDLWLSTLCGILLTALCLPLGVVVVDGLSPLQRVRYV
jgi:cell shape-determining protein MreD